MEHEDRHPSTDEHEADAHLSSWDELEQRLGVEKPAEETPGTELGGRPHEADPRRVGPPVGTQSRAGLPARRLLTLGGALGLVVAIVWVALLSLGDGDEERPARQPAAGFQMPRPDHSSRRERPAPATPARRRLGGRDPDARERHEARQAGDRGSPAREKATSEAVPQAPAVPVAPQAPAVPVAPVSEPPPQPEYAGPPTEAQPDAEGLLDGARDSAEFGL